MGLLLSMTEAIMAAARSTRMHTDKAIIMIIKPVVLMMTIIRLHLGTGQHRLRLRMIQGWVV